MFKAKSRLGWNNMAELYDFPKIITIFIHGWYWFSEDLHLFLFKDCKFIFRK